MRVLVLFSGGVESTSLLRFLLKETTNEVFAHFIERHSPERRFNAERAAVERLLPHLQHVRPFEFSSSFISVCNGEAAYPDWLVDYPIAIAASYHHNCARVYRAGCQEDDWDHIKGQEPVRPSPTPGYSHLRRARSLQALLPGHISSEEFAPYLPHYTHPKAWHWSYLGDLAPLTWSCRRPISGAQGFTPCHKCHSCEERAAASRGTSAIAQVAAQLERSLSA